MLPLYRIPIQKANQGLPFYYWVEERMEVLIFEDGGKLRAVQSICPHMGARLESRKAGIRCPWHGLTFCQRTGKSSHSQYQKIREFEVREEGGEILLYDAKSNSSDPA